MMKNKPRIFFTIVFAIIFVAIASFLVSYIRLSMQKTSLAKENLNKIDRVLAMNFEEVEKVLIFVGTKIASDTPNLDLKIIHQIFVQIANIHNFNNNFSWSLFDWVNIGGYQVVNTMHGIKKDPPLIALDRTYLHRANKLWGVIFSEVAIGNPSGVKVIPVGVQIETTKYPRAGAVAAGISVQKIADTVEVHLDRNIDYAVIDSRDGKMVIGSDNFEKYFKDHSALNEFSKESRGIYVKEMGEKYPYKILVRYDKRQFWQEVASASLMIFVQIIGAAMVMIFVRKVI